MSVEQTWNGIDKGKLKYWDKGLSRCHSDRQKSQRNCPWIEPRLPR